MQTNEKAIFQCLDNLKACYRGILYKIPYKQAQIINRNLTSIEKTLTKLFITSKN